MRDKLILLALFFPFISLSQGKLSDYRRANAVDTLFANKVDHWPQSFHWLKDKHEFWYVTKSNGEKRFVVVNADKRSKAPLFDHRKVALSLSKGLNKKVNEDNLPFDRVDFPKKGKMSFTIDSAEWQVDLANYSVEFVKVISDKKTSGYWGNYFDEHGCERAKSPDSTYVAFIENSNLYIKEIASGRKIQLSYDGSEGEFYSSYVQWSPNGKYLMAYKVRPATGRQIFFVESSPEDQLQPKLSYRDYRKPGDALPIKSPQLFLVEERKHVSVPNELFLSQFSLSDIEWRKDSRAFTFEYNERGHQNYKVIEVSAPDGEVRTLLQEQSPTFIDYSGKKFRKDVDDGKEIIWASERDGWNHLYLYDGVTGKVKRQITKGEWVVRRVAHVDEIKRSIIFAASGLDRDKDPYMINYCRVNFDGTGFTRLTSEDANHSATFSDDHSFFIDQYSRVDIPPVTVLRSSADGKEIMTLERAGIERLRATGWKPPEVFVAKGRDGTTDIWGIIVRPLNFDPQKKYPLIEYIYAGPHSSHVPKSFRPYMWSMHALAELGFIVVQIDGMGTSNRSKAFHDVCWKNLKDAGFPDRILWIKAAAERYNYVDTTNVGIYGVSAGGQSAAGAILFHPEFYKVAVSSCGCHDNRMDKIWWNEQWMGYPVGTEYEASSNVVNAHKMEGNLMLILGEVDDNVDPASTMQFANALIKAEKNFELVVIPGLGHSAGGQYGERKRRDFFVKHLLGMEPPSWEDAYGDDKNEN